MRASPTSGRSLVIGTLLAALSAGCLIAFTLVAGNADYPSTDRVEAAAQPSVVAPVTLTARSNGDEDRSPRVRPGSASDPNQPIVLGIQVTDPDAPDRDRDRRSKRSPKQNKKDTPKKNNDKEPDTDGSPPRVAKPNLQPPQTDVHAPKGHAYGHDKKAKSPGSLVSGAPSSSSNHGPPAHASSNSKSSGPPAHASSNSKSSGPPAHASANGRSKHPKGK